MSIDDVMTEYNIRYQSIIKDRLIKFGKNSDKYLSQRCEHFPPQKKIKIISGYNPEEKTLKQYCEEIGINSTTFRRREKLYS